MELYEKEIKPRVENLSESNMGDMMHNASENFVEARERFRKNRFIDIDEEKKKENISIIRQSVVELAANCLAIIGKIDEES